MLEMTWELLQVTDLHFGDLYLDEDKVPLTPGERDNLKPKVNHYLKVYAKTGLPDAFLVTGDITVRGDDNGMSLGAESLRWFIEEMQNEKRIVAIVPGNHDVKWGLKKSDSHMYDNKFKSFRQHIYSLNGVSTCLIPTRVDIDNNIVFDSKIDPVVVDHERKIIVVCINSAIRCGELNEELYKNASELLKNLNGTPLACTEMENWIRGRCMFDIAHVTQVQRDKIDENLAVLKNSFNSNNQQWDDYLRVAILHHHLVGFDALSTEHKAFEMTVDAEKVLRLLADHDVHLVLTGHKHHPYIKSHTVVLENGREHSIVVAGGATVLGGLPARGGIPRGFTRIVVKRNSDKKISVLFGILELPDTATQFKNQLSNVKRDPTRIQNFLPINYHNKESHCEIVAQGITLLQGKTGIEGDFSNEWMLWLNVLGCETSKGIIQNFIDNHDSANLVRYASIYHVYGKYDLLVRLDFEPGVKFAPASNRPSLIDEIIKLLKDEEQLQGNEEKLILDIQRVEYVHPPLNKHTLWKQEKYEENRIQRAFLLGVNTKSNFSRNIERQALDEAQSVCSSFNGSWSLHFDKRVFVLEAALTCGSYYNLQKITRKYEKWLDRSPYTKLTHIAYEHTEWKP